MAAALDEAYEQRADFRAIRAFVGLYGRAFQHRRVLAPCTVPATGPALIASNHTAGLDPIMIQSTCPRPIVWIMTREYYDLPVLRPFLQYVQMIPIDRGGRDSRAWRDALRMLKKGRVVGVFPEGRIEKTPDLLPFQTGVALLAVRGGVDLYPVYLDGLQRQTDMLQTYLRPQHPTVAWGQRLAIDKSLESDRPTLQRLTDELTSRMRAIKERHPSHRRKGRSLLA